MVEGMSLLVKESPKQQVTGQAEFSLEHLISCCQAHTVVGGCPLGKEENGQPRVPTLLVRCDDFWQVLDCFYTPPHQAV
jgi:hypothetical protein